MSIWYGDAANVDEEDGNYTITLEETDFSSFVTFVCFYFLQWRKSSHFLKLRVIAPSSGMGVHKHHFVTDCSPQTLRQLI